MQHESHLLPLNHCVNFSNAGKKISLVLKLLFSIRPYLKLHRRVLLILWCGVALVVQVVGGGGMDDR